MPLTIVKYKVSSLGPFSLPSPLAIPTSRFSVVYCCSKHSELLWGSGQCPTLLEQGRMGQQNEKRRRSQFLRCGINPSSVETEVALRETGTFMCMDRLRPFNHHPATILGLRKGKQREWAARSALSLVWYRAKVNKSEAVQNKEVTWEEARGNPTLQKCCHTHMNAGFVFYGYGRAILWILLWLGNYFSPPQLCCSLLSQQRALQGQPQVWMHCWWAQALWYIQMSSSFIFRSSHTNWRVFFSACFLRDPNLLLKNKREQWSFQIYQKGGRSSHRFRLSLWAKATEIIYGRITNLKCAVRRAWFVQFPMKVLIQNCSREIICLCLCRQRILAFSHNLLHLSPALAYINKSLALFHPTFIGQVQGLSLHAW